MPKAKIYAFPKSTKERKKILKKEQDFRLYLIRFLKKCCFVVGLLLAVFTVIDNYESLTEQNLKNFMSYLSVSSEQLEENLSEIPFEVAEYHIVETYGGGIAVASPNNISLLNSGGYPYMSLHIPFKNIGIETTDDLVYVYNTNGTSVITCSALGQVGSLETDGNILSISASNAGFLTVTDEKGYKNTVHVYDEKGTEKFIWNTSDYYVVNADLSHNASDIAVNVLDFDNATNSVIGSVILLNTGENEIVGKFNLGDSVPMDIKFFDNGNIAVLTNNAFYVLDDNLEIEDSISFSNDNLACYDISKTNAVLAIKSEGQNQSSINIINSNGEIDTFPFSHNIIDIEIFKDGFAVLTSRYAKLFDLDMNDVWVREDIATAKNIVLSEDGTTYAIFKEHSEIILPLKTEGDSINDNN